MQATEKQEVQRLDEARALLVEQSVAHLGAMAAVITTLPGRPLDHLASAPTATVLQLAEFATLFLGSEWVKRHASELADADGRLRNKPIRKLAMAEVIRQAAEGR